MKISRILILLLLTIPAQVLLLKVLGQQFYWFDLLLLLTLYIAFYIQGIPLIYIALALGIIKDALSGGLIGLNGFSFPILALVCMILYTRLKISKFYAQFMLIFSLSFLNAMIITFISWVFGIDIIYPSILEYIYTGLGNGILFVILMNLPKIFIRQNKLTPGRYNVR
ncbi:MAG: rod shape-determining protein MreD [Acidobacteria bacterium]|nr:rod shape-determining protein MreD [Acidobacteriota bacterium]